MRVHRLPCFGQKSGLIIESGDWSVPYIFFKFLKKLADNRWEKPSLKEGRVIKINLMELISIIAVFKGETARWTTVHKFGGETTPITVERKDTNIIIQIPGYNRFLKYPETVLVQKLLEHIFSEKIEYATGPSDAKDFSAKYPKKIVPSQKVPPNKQSLYEITSKSQKSSTNGPPNIQGGKIWVDSLMQNEDFCLVRGEITDRRDKAIAFHIQGKNKFWVPISQIRDLGEFDEFQGLWVKRWLLEKNLEAITS